MEDEEEMCDPRPRPDGVLVFHGWRFSDMDLRRKKPTLVAQSYSSAPQTVGR